MSDDAIVRKVRQRRSSKLTPLKAQKRKSSSCFTDGQPDAKRTPSDLSLIFAEVFLFSTKKFNATSQHPDSCKGMPQLLR